MSQSITGYSPLDTEKKAYKKRFLAEKKHDILNEMLTFYSQLSFSKFNNYELINGKIVEEKKVGLLEGSTGIALVLISFIFDQDSWDKVFLIS